MTRRLLNLLTALSLLLCVAVVALWVRSYYVTDQLLWATETHQSVTRGAAEQSAPLWFGGMVQSPGVMGAPNWFVMLLCLILPAIQFRRWVRRRARTRPGLCPSCGYDLRATPGRCPECGAAGGLAGGR